MKIINLISRFLPVLMLGFLSAAVLPSCIEDGYATSPSEQPRFSVDTLDLGVIFTDEPSPTSRFTVHNPHSKILSISRIAISGENARCFRVNVDGLSGETFSDVEIRGKDSIYVFVEATLPENHNDKPVKLDAKLDFTANGVTSSVVLAASGQDVRRLEGVTISEDTRLTPERPYQIFDSLVVAPGATLTIEPGTTLCFHDKAMLIVRGTLKAEGTPERPVVMAGDRTGNVVGDISFDIMSRQWTGVFFTATSRANVLSHTIIKNTVQGVSVAGVTPSDGDDGEAAPWQGPAPEISLTLLNCRLRNSAGLVLEALHADVRAVGCEFAEGGGGLVLLQGGTHVFNHCTFANYYLFSVLGGPSLQFAHVSTDEKTGFDDGSGLPFTSADFSNSIVYGNGTDISHGDLAGTSIFFRSCLLKSEGVDDDNFIATLWDSDPLYYTVREEYIFDYRLRPESPAIASGNAELTLPEAANDGYGLPRGGSPDLGAYVFTPPPAEE